MRPIEFNEKSFIHGLLETCHIPVFRTRDVKDHAKLVNDWYWIVSTFTKGQLTNNSNKLPGMPGIAKAIRKALGHNFDTSNKAG